MFCGTSDGVVSLWDTGKPSLPTYDGVNVQMLVKLFPDYGKKFDRYIYNYFKTKINNGFKKIYYIF